ncbi:MAG: hypothetical protein UZ10_BCD003000035 [Bacteroidetes bacterium OLB10]|nr:MAG: hypothetical protein UZ10_BCD003000035 [Bacteroidetes bacterium OLB10]
MHTGCNNLRKTYALRLFMLTITLSAVKKVMANLMAGEKSVF